MKLKLSNTCERPRAPHDVVPHRAQLVVRAVHQELRLPQARDHVDVDLVRALLEDGVVPRRFQLEHVPDSVDGFYQRVSVFLL